MKRILLTGMSGTGKSSVIRALAAKGYRAVDSDEGYAERGPDGDWIWREDAIQRLLAHEDGPYLFVSGCVTNQGKFYPQFDEIILLRAPAETMLERIQSRTTNPYGKSPEERAEILHHLEAIEPLLRAKATCEIDTRAPLEEVVSLVLATAAGRDDR